MYTSRKLAKRITKKIFELQTAKSGLIDYEKSIE